MTCGSRWDMDGQRIAAYVDLIEELLACPDEQEASVLSAHGDFVDAGLVYVMGLHTSMLQGQGDEQAARRLLGIADILREVLGLEEEPVESSESEDATLFGAQIIQLIVQTEADSAQMYDFFQENLARLDEALLQMLPDIFGRLIQQNNPSIIASAFGSFGNLIQQFLLGNRMLNLELGIASYELALQIYTREAFPQEWSTTQNNLAIAYDNRIRGERFENIEKSIECRKLALQVRTLEDFPEQWAMTQTNLASSYDNRIRGKRIDNVESAIECYQLVLQVYTLEDFPEQWAMTQNNLAISYDNRIRGKRADNLEKSIKCSQRALQIYTLENFPEQWAVTQNNLANAYNSRILGEYAENLEKSIEYCQLALQIYTYNEFPEQWAVVQHNLANAYRKRIRGERADNIEQAIQSYQLALQVRTLNAFPKDWAMTQNNLALAYDDRIRGERADNIERSIECHQLALQVFSLETFPENWAMTQHNLGATYHNRIRGERADNIERSIECYQLALQVYTLETFPEDWAGTQNNLANTYSKRILGVRSENLERSIEFCQFALQVRAFEACPRDWALTHNSLGVIYYERIQGEHADNIERSIESYEQALQVYTRDSFPKDWAMTQNNLANAYSNRIRGERAENLERAIESYEQALQVYTRDSFPKDWAMTQDNLASSYSNRIRGEWAENLERAIESYQQALQVYTRGSFPENWAGTQHNLARAYSERIRGERAENLERAIEFSEQALQVRTRDALPEKWAMTQNNLGTVYSDRIRGERAENLERAIKSYEQALQVRTRDTFPKDCRDTAKNLGNLHLQEKSWESAVEAYRIATDAAETLYQSSISSAGKGDELKAAGNLSRCLVYVQAQLGNYQAVVLTLEQNHARGLSESLNRDRANLSQLQTLDPDLYIKYQNITQQLRNLESDDRDRMVSTDRDRIPENLITTTTQLRKQLKKTIAQIRQVPTYENFLTPIKWENIQEAVTIDRPLVYLVTTPNGGMALIVTIDAIEVLWLNDLTEETLLEILRGPAEAIKLSSYLGAYLDFQKDSKANYPAWYDGIESTTRQLWDLLMGPIVQHLKSKGYDRATLLPTGFLSLLPLHATWTEDSSKPTGKRYAIDDIHFTYTPNAKSLTEARAIADRPFTDSILAIDNPRQDLPNSKREIDCAIDCFSDRTVLRHDNATIDAVKSGLSEAAIVHFSCHGTANFNEPLNSGLLMSDGLLTLKDLLALNLAQDSGIRLAILSACETGLPGLDNIDEVVSLPIGLLQAGVAGVISSLWSVDDASTMMLLTRFYDLWRKDELEPAIALREAQIWLRDTTAQEKKEMYSHFMFRKSTLNDRTCEHPFHWAAFSYLGV